MSSELAQKMREIREVETSGRAEFAQLIGFNKKTVESIEQAGRAPKGEMLQAICQQWPKYTLWLMTDMTDEEAGQVSPKKEKVERAGKRKVSSEKKYERVDVTLEKISKMLRQLLTLFFKRFDAIKKNEELSVEWEKDITLLVKELGELTNIACVYLPYEMRGLLYSFYRISSQKPVGNKDIHELIVDKVGKERLFKLIDESMCIIENMLECFFDMCNRYLEVDCHYDYSDILIKYELDKNGIYAGKELVKRLGWCLLIDLNSNEETAKDFFNEYLKES